MNELKVFWLFLVFLLKETYREPAVIFWAFIFPLIISGVLGLAFGSSKEFSAKAAWVSDSPPPQVAGVTWVICKEKEVIRKLQRGEVLLVAYSEKSGQLILKFDSSNPEANLASNIIENSIHRSAKLENPSVITIPIKTPGSRYIDFLIPGMVAFGIMNACLWGIGSNLIEMRTKKLLIRFYATPFSKNAFFLSFLGIRLLNVVLESLFLIVFSNLVFGVEFTGSWPGLGLLILSGLLCFGGMSILLGSRTAKTQVGYGLINAVSFPMMLCSGIFFSNQGFPEWIQPVVQAFPLSILADSTRSLFLESFSLQDILPQSAILIVIGTVALIFGRYFFRWI